MAVYRNVRVNFWQDEFILDLTPEERYFYIYLLTGTKTKQCGIYILPKRLAELETGYSMETVEKLLNRFVEYGKILYDTETKELYIINWLHYNPILNTNVEKCVLRELKAVKSKEFIHMFYVNVLKKNGRFHYYYSILVCRKRWIIVVRKQLLKKQKMWKR